jgi:hypothetical protein
LQRVIHLILLTLRRTVFILILFSCALTKAQYMDSLDALLRGKYSLDLRLESRNSFIEDQLVSRNGFRIGASFKRKLRLGVGLSWLNTPVISTLYPPVIENDTIVHNLYVKLAYVCYYADVVFHKTKRWQLSIPLQFGTGMEWLEDPLLPSDQRSQKQHFLLLYEPGITIQYKFFKWFGAGADITYLFILNKSQTTGRLSSQTFTFKILFWFDHLFYDLFPNSKITKKFGPSYW